MNQAVLKAEVRSECGKGAARRLRDAGYIPGVLYGKDMDPIAIKLDQRDVSKVLKEYGTTKVFKLQLEGAETKKKKGGSAEKNVMVKEIQSDVLSCRITHIDVHAISLTEEITVNVPLVLKGEKENDGGILEQLLWEVEIKTLPTNIPDSIEVNIDGLKIGDSVFVRDLVLPEGIEVLAPEEEVVVSIAAPKVVAEEAPEAGEEPEKKGEDTAAE